MEDEFGDFTEINIETGEPTVQESHDAPVRVRLPRKGELIGVIVQRYGGNRMDVLSSDGKNRNCRVPGRFKRTLWLRPKDTVLIVPWVDDDSKGDVVFKYSGSAINQLRKKGMLDNLKVDF